MIDTLYQIILMWHYSKVEVKTQTRAILVKTRKSSDVADVNPLIDISLRLSCHDYMKNSTFPLVREKGFTNIDQYELFLKFNRIGKEFDKDITATVIVGYRDSRLRKLQYGNYAYFSSVYPWLTKCEFPLLFGLGKLKTDKPMQDMVHVIEKLWNNWKFRSTMVLPLCDQLRIEMSCRQKYAVHWLRNKGKERLREREYLLLQYLYFLSGQVLSLGEPK